MHNFENIESLETGKIILVFSTDWCPDCVVLKQFLPLVVERYKEDWKFIYIDSDQNLELSKHYNVFGIPSFVALNDGVQKGEFISKNGKTFTEVCEWIENIKE